MCSLDLAKYEAAASGSPCPSPSPPRSRLVIGFLAAHAGRVFIMITLAFAQMLYSVFHDTKLGGGSDGIYISIRPELTVAGTKPLDLENPCILLFRAPGHDRRIRVAQPGSARTIRTGR
jgi:hypothetical protein